MALTDFKGNKRQTTHIIRSSYFEVKCHLADKFKQRKQGQQHEGALRVGGFVLTSAGGRGRK